MARFRGTVRGGRGTGSRLGHATTGLHTEARSWNGSIEVTLFDKNGEDYANVWLIAGNGMKRSLYWGPLSKWVNPRLERIEFISLWDDDKQEKV